MDTARGAYSSLAEGKGQIVHPRHFILGLQCPRLSKKGQDIQYDDYVSNVHLTAITETDRYKPKPNFQAFFRLEAVLSRPYDSFPSI